MAIYNYTKINVGGQANDGTGDNIRDAFVKVNTNLDLLFTLGSNNVILADVYNTLTTFKAILDTIPQDVGSAASVIYVDSSTATAYNNAVSYTNQATATTRAIVLSTTATGSTLGVVKVGSGINRADDGTISTNYADPIDITNTTQGTYPPRPQDSPTGALIVRGGIAVKKDIVTNGNIYMKNTVSNTAFFLQPGVDGLGNSVGELSIQHNSANGYINFTGSQGNNIASSVQGLGGDGGNLFLQSGVDASVIVTSTAASTGTSTGALIVAGGVGIRGNLYVGGTSFIAGAQIITTATIGNYSASASTTGTTTTFTISNIAGTTSTTTGALIVAGGAGFGGGLYVGGEVTATSITSAGTVNFGGLYQTSRAYNTIGGIVDITTSSPSYGATTGGLIVRGGVGIVEDLNTTGDINITSPSGAKRFNMYTGGGAYGGPGLLSFSHNVVDGYIEFYGKEGAYPYGGNNLYIRNTTNGSNNPIGSVILPSTATSVSTQSGALIVVGGVGISGNVNIGKILSLTLSTAAPASPTVGMFAVADRVNWDPASKGSGNAYPVFYDGSTWNALY